VRNKKFLLVPGRILFMEELEFFYIESGDFYSFR
ncbi:hypothetical protein LEP1GSC035_1043, partial [Leptospira noguchii str. 2007001578]